MTQEYFIKAEVIKVATMAAKGGTMRITFDVPLIEKTATLAMAQNKTAALMMQPVRWGYSMRKNGREKKSKLFTASL